MFDQIFGDIQKKQEDLKKQLAEEIIEYDYQDGAISIKLNANKEILNISIDSNKLDINDKEQLEDFLVIGMNEALQVAEEKQKEHSQSLIQDVMPGGLDKLFGQ